MQKIETALYFLLVFLPGESFSDSCQGHIDMTFNSAFDFSLPFVDGLSFTEFDQSATVPSYVFTIL